MNSSELQLIKDYLTYIKKDKNIDPFLLPVDYEGLGLIDYPKVIAKPMDLETITKNVNNNKYNSIDEAKADIQLIWDNCRKYNLEGSAIFKLANNFEKITKKYFDKHGNNNNSHNNKKKKNNNNNDDDNHKNNSNKNNEKNNNNNDLNENNNNNNKNDNNSNKKKDKKDDNEKNNNNNENDNNNNNDENNNKLSGAEKSNLNNRIKKLQNEGLANLVRLVQKECPNSVNENEENIEITLSILDRKTYEKINSLIDTYLKGKDTNQENIDNNKLNNNNNNNEN